MDEFLSGITILRYYWDMISSYFNSSFYIIERAGETQVSGLLYLSNIKYVGTSLFVPSPAGFKDSFNSP